MLLTNNQNMIQVMLDKLDSPYLRYIFFLLGFDSLLTDQSSSCIPDVEKIVPRTSKDTSLGAIPKRRAPRIRASASAKPDVERLTKLRSGKLNLETKLDEVDNVGGGWGGGQVDSLCSMVRMSKEGRDSLDIVRLLCEMDLSHVTATIYSYLQPEDLCKVSQVISLTLLILCT